MPTSGFSPSDMSLDELRAQVAMLAADNAALRERVQHLERVHQHEDQLKDDFLALLGHELRNPLAAIRSAADLLKLKNIDDPQVVRMRSVLDRQTKRMVRLVDDLLDVSRIARGKVLLNREHFDLTTYMKGWFEDNEARVAQHGLRLATELPTRPVLIYADKVRLGQILDNLLSNAIKFTAAGGTIGVVVGCDDETVTLAVQDTGVGIAPEVRDHIFDPFRQGSSDTGSHPRGLGLGLPLAKGLAELHGGRVDFHSNGIGQGAEFCVHLPIVGKSVEGGDSAQASATATGRRILVVENERDSARVLKDVLELAGHQVQVAHDGRSAGAIARSMKPDVLLCDLEMPGEMNGYDVARLVRSEMSEACPRLLAVSGYSGPETREQAIEAGFDGCLAKPLDVRTIERVIHELEERPE